MSFLIQAPYPALQTSTILPSPEFSDQEALTNTVSANRAVDGTLFTYIKRKNGRRKMQWTFQVSRNKGLELRAFLVAYFYSEVKLTDHHDRVWVGNFTNNPFEFKTDRREGPAIQGWPRGEGQTITLEFEGIEQV